VGERALDRGAATTLDPEATRKDVRRAALRTGDLGYLVNGNVYITGRKKD